MTTVSALKGRSDNNTAVPFTSIRAADLVAAGTPFLEFPCYSILDLQQTTGIGGGGGHTGSQDKNGQINGEWGEPSDGFSKWFTRRLHIGQPFVIRDFEKLSQWDRRLLSIESLIELSTKKNIPIRNCSTARDLNFTLKKFADAAHRSYREFKNLYARDLQCPEAWLEKCKTFLPSEVQWGGNMDLFQWLPSCARSEVVMAYVGSEGSSCFSSTVALNLLVEASDRPVLCFGTDFESQSKYDAFMAARGASPHVDWLNLSPDELQKANFPLYVHEQKVGELVVFPHAAAHQVWNLGAISTKMVWNILHPLSLEAGLNYVQPPFNRLCRPDVARSNLSLACAMLSLLRDKPSSIPPDLPLLTKLFCQMVRDEMFDDPPVTPISLVRIPDTAIATCNFCGTAIWNRHLRCNECRDFDLCLLCFLGGRSCEHLSSHTWAEIVPPETCSQVIRRGESILGYKIEENINSGNRKTLATAVNELMRARRSNAIKLCHLCRIDHLEWKGRRCDTCSAFFCFRGLFRHFDMNSTDVLRHSGLWCCHFPSAYVKAEKPASKRRVKPVDHRGKIMGFTDNVFDQKRRTPAPSTSSSSSAYVIPTSRPQKRSLSVTSTTVPNFKSTSNPHADLPTPESDRSFGSHNKDGDQIISGPVDSEYSLPRGKIPRSSSDSSNHSRLIQNEILHGIDYITQMPSPQADQLSLPPLKSQRNPTGGLVPGSPKPSHPPLNDGMSALADVAAASRIKMTIPRPHEFLPSRDVKYDHGGAVISTTPTTTSSHAHTLSRPTSSSALAHAHQPEPSNNLSSNLTSPHSLAPMGPSKSSPTSPPQAPVPPHISDLEARLRRLRHYASELLALSLHDSHSLIQQEIRETEEKLHLAKKERGERLLKDLELEFPNLIELMEGIKREGGRKGLF
ncbi:hypothetical protein EMPG_11939 [Blastomyces silverae]|uniref:ZZ-type domain-containing protein n=1 Tax=Blastomyces silverae TaxID=2060906 RepID=A0A0H1BP22_9EURO|nr:hypothetical protein EMPG_11939 [Blastomyces silverae]